MPRPSRAGRQFGKDRTTETDTPQSTVQEPAWLDWFGTSHMDVAGNRNPKARIHDGQVGMGIRMRCNHQSRDTP